MEPASSAEDAGASRRPGDLAARIVTAVVAGLVLLPNLAFPYSEDGGTFAAAARLRLEGLALYREIFDQKPPAIVLQESLRIALLGISPVAARVFELVVLLAASIVFRDAVRPFLPRDRAEPGGNAATLSFAIATSSAFWGLLERGMVEVYQAAAIAIALGALGPILATPREGPTREDTVRAALAGAALAWASWLKPQALLLVVVAAVVLATTSGESGRRAPRVRGRLVVALLAAVGLVSLPVIVAMIARGELRAFLWTMTEFNAAYVASAHGKPAAAAKLLAIWEVRGGLWFLFVAVPGVGLVALRAQRRLVSVPAIVLLLAVAAWSVFAFASGAFLFPYQSLVAVPAIALSFALSVEAAAFALGRVLPARAAQGVLLAIVVALTARTARFLRAAEPFARWTFGGLSTDAMHAKLGTSGFFRYDVQREAARVVEARTAPDETFYVFGRAGVTYLFAHRRPASRQLATVLAYWPERTARTFHDELVRDLTSRPPKLLLVRIDDAMPWFGVNAPSSVLLERDPELAPFVARHYRVVGRIDDAMIVLERCPGEACMAAASEQHGPAHGPG